MTAYCQHCGDPYPVQLPECPECLTAQVMRPVPTSALAAELSENGVREVLIVRRAGRLESFKDWPSPSMCDCTDGGRNAPCVDCSMCGGRGTL